MGQLDASVVTVAFPALQTAVRHRARVGPVGVAAILALTARWPRPGRPLVGPGWPQADVPVRVRRVRGFLGGVRAGALARNADRAARCPGCRSGAATGEQRGFWWSPACPRIPAGAALGVQAAAQAVGLGVRPGDRRVCSWRRPAGAGVSSHNVPVGVLAVVAGVHPLPRTQVGLARQPLAAPSSDADPLASQPPHGQHRVGQFQVGQRGTDPGGTVLLAAATTTGMLAISALSGLGAPAWTAAVFAAVTVLAGIALFRHSETVEPGTAARPARHGRFWYQFGTARCPLRLPRPVWPPVLFPQVVSARKGSAESAGLLLTVTFQPGSGWPRPSLTNCSLRAGRTGAAASSAAR